MGGGATAEADAANVHASMGLQKAVAQRVAVLSLQFGAEALPDFRKACREALPDTLPVDDASDGLFDTILATDVIYGGQPERTARDLVATVAGLLKPGSDSCFLLGFVSRATGAETALCRTAQAAGLISTKLSEQRCEDHVVKIFKFVWR